MYQYRVKVRAQTYLWGGIGVRQELQSKLLLTFRVEETGEPIDFGTARADGTPPADGPIIGRIEAGETYTMRLDNLCGVYARCRYDTLVTCVIHSDCSPNL